MSFTLFMFFDYIYYRTYVIYSRVWRSSIPTVYAVMLITLLQALNISSFFAFYLILSKSNFRPKPELGLYLFFTLLIINLIRIRKQFPRLDAKWKLENMNVRKRNGIIMVLYIILSCALFLTLAGILGKSHNI